jgi:hypothetical protein
LRVRASSSQRVLASCEENRRGRAARSLRCAAEGGFDMSPLLAAALGVAIMVSFVFVFGVVPGLRGRGH